MYFSPRHSSFQLWGPEKLFSLSESQFLIYKVKLVPTISAQSKLSKTDTSRCEMIQKSHYHGSVSISPLFLHFAFFSASAPLPSPASPGCLSCGSKNDSSVFRPLLHTLHAPKEEDWSPPVVSVDGKGNFLPGSPSSCLLTSHQANLVPCPS